MSNCLTIVATKTNPNFLSTLTRKIQVTEYLRLQQLSTGDLGYLGMETTIPKKTSYLNPSLTLVEDVPDATKKSEGITSVLKQRANATAATAATYKMTVQRFDEGTVQEWIAVRAKFEEIFTQNSVTGPTDQLATVRSILRGDSLTCFNTYIVDHSAYINDQGVPTNIVLTLDGVLAGLHAVAETVFPFRALSNQKLWMRRGMKKPKELSFRKTAAAVGRLNNSLPLFPGGTEADKFSDEEIVELLEWSIPQAWRTKFDLDGYIPTSFPKARLVVECEILERNDPHKPVKVLPKLKEKPFKKGASPKYKSGSKSTDKKAGFYCTEHGANPTHNTDKCFTIQGRAKRATDSTSLTKKSFRREINLLSRKGKNPKVLDMFATVLREERAKASKKKKASKQAKKRKQREEASSSSDSSSDEEDCHVMDFKMDLKKQRAKKRAVETSSETDDTTSDQESKESPEEKAYREKIQQLGQSKDAEGTEDPPTKED